jgi:sugar/nucleoside kinase (ribokinase family)
MSIRFLIAGGITIDTLIGLGSDRKNTREQASQGQNMVGESRQSGTVVCGGNAVYAGIGAAIWADQPGDIGLVACLGTGYPGSWIDELRATRLDLAGVRVLDEPHALAFQAVYDRLGRRREQLIVHETSGTADGAGAAQDNTSEVRARFLPVVDDRLPQGYLEAEAALCSQYGLDKQHEACMYLHERGIRIFLDPDEAQSARLSPGQLRRFLEPVDVFLPSEKEIPVFMRRHTPFRPEHIVRRLGRYGPAVVALKLGRHGSIVYDRVPRSTWPFPAPADRVLDPTGAGDAYCGGFMVGYVQTGDACEAALRATVSASFVIESVGALPALEALPVLRQEAPTRLEQLRRLLDGRLSSGSLGTTA